MKSCVRMICALILCASATLGQAAYGQIPANGPLAWYPFSGNMNDESGNGHNGTNHGAGFTADRNGTPGHAAAFSGSGQYITLPPLTILYDLTVSFWIQTTANDPNDWPSAMFLVDRDLCSATRDWSVGIGNNGKVQFNTGIPDLPLVSSATVNDGAWHHVAVVRDLWNHQRCIYIDGTLDAWEAWNNKSFMNNAEDIYLGINACDQAHHTFYSGAIDDIAIYDKALTPADITGLYGSGSNHAPVPVCADVTVNAGASCAANASIDNGSYDPDGDALTLTQIPPGPYPVGTSRVILLAVDTHGASDTSSAYVTVVDHTPPVARGKHVSVTLSHGHAHITAEQVNDASADACGIRGMTVAPDNFTCADIGDNTVTLTVDDNNGNTAAATATVTVLGAPAEPAIAVEPQIPLSPGGAARTLYLGYGPQSATLHATGGVSYQWSSTPAGFTSTSADPVVSPTQTTMYVVTATNEYGCIGDAEATVFVVDARCGKKNDKVLVCHNGHAICVAPSAVPAHLAHGDMLGDCTAPSYGASYRAQAAAQPALDQNYPNPFGMAASNPSSIITFRLPEAAQVALRVYDSRGRLVRTLAAGMLAAGEHRAAFDATGLPGGVYFYTLTAAGITRTRAMTVLR